MEGEIFLSNDDIICSLKNRELSSIKTIYNKYAYGLSGVIALIIADEKTRNKVLERTFIEVWNEANSYNPATNSIFIWLLRITIRVMAEHLNLPLIDMQKLVLSAYKEIKAKRSQNEI